MPVTGRRACGCATRSARSRPGWIPTPSPSLARNLIENALRHGEGAVEVTLGAEGLRVTNGGPALAPDLLARIPQRFARGSSTREGSGLGLAIAAGIARGAGWRLALTSPIPGRPDGFEARAIPPQPRIA